MPAVNLNAAGLVAADFAVDHVLSALAITDTASHPSASSDCRGYKSKIIWLNYTLNQQCTLAVQCSPDGVTASSWVTLGSFTVPAAFGYGAVNALGGGGAGTEANLSDAWAFMRLLVQCGTAPSTGTVDAWFHKQAS